MRNSAVDFNIYLQEHVFQVKKNNGQLAARVDRPGNYCLRCKQNGYTCICARLDIRFLSGRLLFVTDKAISVFFFNGFVGLTVSDGPV